MSQPASCPPPPPPPPPPRAPGGRLLVVLLAVQTLLLLLAVGIVGWVAWNFFEVYGSDQKVEERVVSGKSLGSKVAVLHVDGVLLEGMNEFTVRQLEQAATDPQVTAVVLRINSPGGSITASDALYRRIHKLRHGDPARNRPARPVVVSMASMAASGGYYIATPAEKIYAERTTMTGSIGVYAAFPNVSGLGKQLGISMELVKRGDVKDAGSPFHEMTPQEHQVWQDVVDDAYDRFVAVVEEGRPKLAGKLTRPVEEREIETVTQDGARRKVPYVRRLADGGVFTAPRALEYGLIDAIGSLDDAIADARQRAGLPIDAAVIEYSRPRTLLGSLLGVKGGQADPFRTDTLSAAATPRVWYLAPGSEAAGWLQAAQ